MSLEGEFLQFLIILFKFIFLALSMRCLDQNLHTSINLYSFWVIVVDQVIF